MGRHGAARDAVDLMDGVDWVDGFEDEDDDEYENEILAHAFWRRIASRGLVALAVSRSWPTPTS